ncbi:MAG: cell division protein ZapE [Halieaceae bacterium]|nr:MAG: cell division protein ZapE [Halieaceae bacterium]
MTDALSPLQRYQNDLKAGTLLADAAQASVIEQLDDLHARLLARVARQHTIWSRTQRLLGRSEGPERGLYLWGGVGRGKTHLVDTFFDSLPIERKLRVHFHRFMQRVHAALTRYSGAKNPLEVVAQDIADDAVVLCFDEFFVSDIGDAMILAGLIEALFRRGVTLVATSNIPPKDLYRDGLQRSRFLPAIALLEQHLTVSHLDSATDYRFRTLQRADLWHVPHDSAASDALTEYFTSLTGRAVGAPTSIEVNQRQMTLIADAPGVAWFSFGTLCEEARSAADYVEIAREYHTVLIEQIPQLGRDNENAARRFINLVDEFYDRSVKLITTATTPPEALYEGSRLAFEFDRTVSRLQEMRTQEYLRAEHRP